MNGPLMSSQVEELGDNRVRLTVDVSVHELEHAVEHATNDLSESVRIPGFRKGKVPTPVLISKIGKDRIWVEAVESHISGWFWAAAARTRLRPIAAPEYDFELPTTEKEQWSFSATIEVQPTPEVVDWTTLEVPRVEAEIPQELVDQELEALRQTVAELVPADDRAAAEGDTLVIDLVGEDGEVQSDTVVELGSGRLVEEIEAALVGSSVGEAKEITYELADESETSVSITIKHINQKVLPEIDDELARSASEFDTLAELRAEIEGRILTAVEAEIDSAFRTAAVDALVGASNVKGAGPLVETRARELLDGFVRSLDRRGIAPETYFQVTGQTPEILIAQMHAEAAQSVARELALEAVADKVGIEISDDDVKALIREQAELSGDNPEEVVEGIWAHGHQESLREDLRMRAALDRLVAEVKPISPDLAEARDKMWTPDKENTEPEKKLWTPGSKEPE
ncbi:MAG: trigger factor [Thermoleophilia bacterium]|nr:trigger factor [Thermoleophilia bacterium]